MEKDIEHVQARLANIRTVGPLLTALRTIALGNWQVALNRRKDLQRYGERLLAILPALLPYLITDRRGSRARQEAAPETPESGVVLAIGSERGLCGRFNTGMIERVDHDMTTRELLGGQVELAALGSRIARALQRQGHAPAWSQSLPVTALPSFELAFSLTRQWLQRYEAQELDAVDVVYNAYEGAGRYVPTVTRLIPPQLPDTSAAVTGAWPPPIVETDPLQLYTRIVEQWAAISFYGLLLESAASEHSARFQLMESAKQNVDRLVEELTLTIQSARREAITREMQELAAGAGLLGA